SGSIDEWLLRKMSLERRHRVVWHTKFGVRNGVVEIDEERPVIALFDERHRFAREQIVRVVIRTDFDPLSVAIKMVGELAVRMRLREIAERVFEALAIGPAGRLRFAESPLANERRAVPRVLQH